MKIVVSLLVLCIVVLGILYVMDDGREASAYSWKFEALPEQNGMPVTDVTLVYKDREFDTGAHVGTCFDIANSEWELLPNEVAGAICWWAGGGREIGVFIESEDRIVREYANLVVKLGQLDEGDAEVPSVRGPFVDMFRITDTGAVLPPRPMSVAVTLGETAETPHVAIKVIEILEDSRCPVDVQCIQAGTVRLTVELVTGMGTAEEEFSLGSFISTETATVTFEDVTPPKRSTEPVSENDYVFTFSVAPFLQ